MSKIVKVEVGRFDYDFVGEFKFFKPGPDGKVTRPSVLLRLTDGDGVQGWGQAVPTPSWTYETPESVETTIANYLAKVLLGMDPENIEDIHYQMNHAISPDLTIGQPLAKAAVDIACHDLVGKQRGQSVAEMLGGRKQDWLQMSWTVASPDLAVVKSQMEEGRERGYCNFNIKVGPPQTEAYDLELARLVKTFTPNGFLWADANTGYDLETALRVIPKLADAGVEVIESPLPPYQIRAYQTLKKQSPLPIFMDEGIILDAVVKEFIALDMLDGITIKTSRSSGIWQSQKIIRLAQENDLALLGSGLTDPDISLAATLHLFAWAGLDRPCALNGTQFLGNTLIESGMDRQGELIGVPSGPGLGITMKPEAENYLTTVVEL